MNRKLYTDLINKGMDAATARELATEHTADEGHQLDDVVDEISRLAKGNASMVGVEELREDFEQRLGEANDIVEAVVAAADKAIDASTEGTAKLAKGLSAVLRTLQTLEARFDDLANKVDGVAAVGGDLQKGLSLVRDNGNKPAATIATDPARHGVIAAPGDTTERATFSPMQVADILSKRADAEADPAKRAHLAKGVALALSGGDIRNLIDSYNVAS